MITEYKGVKFESFGYDSPENDVSEKEAQAYIERGLEMYPTLTHIEGVLHGEDIDLKYTFKKKTPFARIRRITGYLVGTLDRFNDAKKAEEHDRVKHGLNKE